jgi:hypothetical protein
VRAARALRRGAPHWRGILLLPRGVGWSRPWGREVGREASAGLGFGRVAAVVGGGFLAPAPVLAAAPPSSGSGRPTRSGCGGGGGHQLNR